MSKARAQASCGGAYVQPRASHPSCSGIPALSPWRTHRRHVSALHVRQVLEEAIRGELMQRQQRASYSPSSGPARSTTSQVRARSPNATYPASCSAVSDGGAARAAYRTLMRAVSRHVTSVSGNGMFRDALRAEFRAGAAQRDPAAAAAAVARAQDAAFYVNAVNEHKARPCCDTPQARMPPCKG